MSPPLHEPDQRAPDDGALAGASGGRWAAALVLSAAAALAYHYVKSVDLPYLGARLALHDEILRGEALSPYRYRVLVPFLAEVMAAPLEALVPRRDAIVAAYAVFDFAAFGALFGALYGFLRAWFSREAALIGVLFAGSTMVVALRDHAFQPWSLLEAALVPAGLWLLHRERLGAFAAVALVGVVNRETTGVLVLAYFATLGLDALRARSSPDALVAATARRRLAFGAAIALAAVGLLAALRLARGPAEPVYRVLPLLEKNLRPGDLVKTAVQTGLFLGAGWVLAARGIRRAPEFVRRAAWIVPPYALAVGLYGRWHEVRLLMPLYPILLAAALSWLARSAPQAAASAGAR
ncbi:hypothetical protein [Sorangium sp. So ce854]|uniref:hypothetical protein n=1 Tax=Sorangium sp. So ce854 TaxID=3133322 RepID=UPI003F6001ED